MQRSIGILSLVALSGVTNAGITSYTSDTTQIGDVTHYADFNSLTHAQSLINYQEDGLVVSVQRDYFSWNVPGFDGSEMFYGDTGSLEMVSISLVDGSDFTDIDMQIASGWSPLELGTMYLWIQLYDNGDLVHEMNLDAITGEYVGLVGGGFDQILIGSYASSGIRDSRNANARNAIALDNIRVGTVVPAPGTLIIPAMALAGFRRRR